MENKVQNQCNTGKSALAQFILNIEVDKSEAVDGSSEQDEKDIFHFQFFQFTQTPFVNINFCIIV